MEDKAAIENSMQSHKMIVSIWPIGLNDLLMLRNELFIVRNESQ